MAESHESMQTVKRRPTEWEQTVVAAEASKKKSKKPAPEPEPGPAPAPEPVPELETPEPPAELEPLGDEEVPLETLEPEPVEAAEAPPMDVPADLESFVRFDGGNLVIKQPYLDRAKRAELEKRLGGARGRLRELRWHPRKREPIHAIERAVDQLKWQPKYEPVAVDWIKRRRADRSTALKGLQRLPGNILDKRVVYETEGGYVVEVVHRELGETRKSYFIVPAQGSSKAALAAIRQGRFAHATLVSPEVVDVVASGPARGTGGVPPGKIHTWPIRNRTPVARFVGMTSRVEGALAKLGITTTDQLRVWSPLLLARNLPVGVDECRRWRAASELLLLGGMDAQHADALAAAGVEGLAHLQRLEAQDVADKVAAWLKTVRGRKPIRGIGAARARRWINAARRMKKQRQPFPV